VTASFRLGQVSDMGSPLGKVLVHPNEPPASELRTGKSNTGRRQAAQRPHEWWRTVPTIGIQRESQSADLSVRQHGRALAGGWPGRIPKPCVDHRCLHRDDGTLFSQY
jgi:hypothetical protein